MAQPTWITPVGSLGVIPEGVFYQQNMLASTPIEVSLECTATTAGTDTITCTSTAALWENLNVIFTGTLFGGVEPNVRYFVNRIVSDTEFTIATTEFADRNVTLTTATGSMTGEFTQHVYFKLISGELPPGIQCSDNGLIIGVPKAVASLQGVPFDVNRDVTSRFTVRGYTLRPVSGILTVDGIRDRTFSLTVTGDDTPQWVTPAGSIGEYYDGDLIDFQLDYTNSDPGDVVAARVVGGSLPGGVTLSSTGLLYGYIEPATNVNEPPGYDLTPEDIYPYDFMVSATDKNYQFTVEIGDGKNSNLRTFSFFVYNRDTLTADDTQITADNTFVTADETTSRAPFLENAFPSDLGSVRSNNYFAYQFKGNDYDTADIEYVISVNEGGGLPPGLTLDSTTGWYYGYIPDQGVTEVTYSFNIQVRQVSDPTIASQLYPFTLSIVGAIDAEVSWITPADDTAYTKKINGVSTTVYDLGDIDNGAVSLFYVEAVNRGGRDLSYKLKSGAFNELPQGLTLQLNGDIAGKVSFDTFSVDQGYTTFDKTQSTTLNRTISETTFDSVFVFTVNAFAEDTAQVIYKVESIEVVDGGTGFSTPPTITLNTPIGAEAVAATVGTVTVSAGAITSVTVDDPGNGYTSEATYTITGSGSGALLRVNMRPSGTKDVVSVDRTCSIRVNRAYNKPYQNLYIEAMPPANDRQLILELLQNQEIFQPDFIYRPNDPNFGKSKKVTYQHAYGLDPDILDVYVEALYKNHYFKDLTLGQIKTAQALDANGNVVYEVVYSQVVDNLVNNAGESVNDIVNLPYPIIDPTDGSTILTQVYPNSLVNMRNRMVDVVGQISTKLPLWMTSKQTNGQVLGFTPSWVICYTKPGRSDQIAYYISTKFGQPLNLVDFKVDRYILDANLSRNWDPTKVITFGDGFLVGAWDPTANLTTFDRYYTPDQVSIGDVSIATNLAFADVNNQPLSVINAKGGLDGVIGSINNNTLIFATQEGYADFATTDDAWQNYVVTFDSDGFDATGTSFDESDTVPGGYTTTCTDTTSGTNVITCDDTSFMNVGDSIWFSGDDLSGLVAVDGTNVYAIYSIESSTTFKLEDPNNPGNPLALTTDSGTMTSFYGNERMALWTITVTDDVVTLTPYQNTGANQYVTIQRGKYYINSKLYYSTSPPPGLSRVTWVNVPEGSSTETTFDQGSLQFVAPVDMYDPTTTYDKYLVYPKANILE